ncbi:DUF3703 domain-containing protein [Comamonas sp.]|uniref:DUF3703 domain-containing protein n=1 Tax=Comamonas sp. TaxID=34028 RepID=UPI0012CAF040|nr:DUF3703 domain-containing protein [Comamonas sp.]MPS93227.1 DUF3703 domain-containing protein [Comamonas sp.]
MTDAQRRAAFAHLLHRFHSSQDLEPAQRWLLLEASHVLGQQLLGLHWRSHCWMLRHALQLRDAREVAGQLLRLALLPAGHLLDRLPRGNTGRATVPATLPMDMPPAVSVLIAEALRATLHAPRQRPRV